MDPVLVHLREQQCSDGDTVTFYRFTGGGIDQKLQTGWFIPASEFSRLLTGYKVEMEKQVAGMRDAARDSNANAASAKVAVDEAERIKRSRERDIDHAFYTASRVLSVLAGLDLARRDDVVTMVTALDNGDF